MAMLPLCFYYNTGLGQVNQPIKGKYHGQYMRLLFGIFYL